MAAAGRPSAQPSGGQGVAGRAYGCECGGGERWWREAERAGWDGAGWAARWRVAAWRCGGGAVAVRWRTEVDEEAPNVVRRLGGCLEVGHLVLARIGLPILGGD